MDPISPSLQRLVLIMAIATALGWAVYAGVA